MKSQNLKENEINTKKEREQITVPESKKKNKKKRFKRSIDILFLIVSIIVAILLWGFVTADDAEYEQSFEIPVEVRNNTSIPAGLSLYSNIEGNTINITISGKRSRVTKLTEKELIAYVDLQEGLANAENPNDYPVEIKFDIPNDIVLTEKSKNVLIAKLDFKIDRTFPIEIKIKESNLPSEYEIVNPYTETIKNIIITGAKAELDNISSVGIEIRLNTFEKADSYTSTNTVTLLNKKGEVVTPKYIEITGALDHNDIEVPNFTAATPIKAILPVIMKKTISLEVVGKNGYINETYAQISITTKPNGFDEPKTINKITILGSPSTISTLNSIIVETLDETKINSDIYSQTVTFKLPQGVSLTQTEKETLSADEVYDPQSEIFNVFFEIVFKSKTTPQIGINANSTIIKSGTYQGEINSIKITTNLDITLRIPDEFTLAPSDIIITLDLTGQTFVSNKATTVQVPYLITLSERAIAAGVYEIKTEITLPSRLTITVNSTN